jgi:hypothetical protein
LARPWGQTEEADRSRRAGVSRAPEDNALPAERELGPLPVAHHTGHEIAACLQSHDPATIDQPGTELPDGRYQADPAGVVLAVLRAQEALAAEAIGHAFTRLRQPIGVRALFLEELVQLAGGPGHGRRRQQGVEMPRAQRVDLTPDPKEGLGRSIIGAEVLVADRPGLGEVGVVGFGVVLPRCEILGVEALQGHPIQRAGSPRAGTDEGDETPQARAGAVVDHVPPAAGPRQDIGMLGGSGLGTIEERLGKVPTQGVIVGELGPALLTEQHPLAGPGQRMAERGPSHACANDDGIPLRVDQLIQHGDAQAQA